MHIQRIAPPLRRHLRAWSMGYEASSTTTVFFSPTSRLRSAMLDRELVVQDDDDATQCNTYTHRRSEGTWLCKRWRKFLSLFACRTRTQIKASYSRWQRRSCWMLDPKQPNHAHPKMIQPESKPMIQTDGDRPYFSVASFDRIGNIWPESNQTQPMLSPKRY